MQGRVADGEAGEEKTEMKTEMEAERKSWPKTGKEMYIILFLDHILSR